MDALRWRRVHRMIETEAVEVQRRQRKAEVERLKAASRHDRAFADAVLQGARADFAAALMETELADPIDGIDGMDGVFSPSPRSGASPTILPGLPGGAALAGAP